MDKYNKRICIVLAIVLYVNSTTLGTAQLQIMHPPSLWSSGTQKTKPNKIQAFINDTQQCVAENDKIPTKNSAIFRIMTYNVHNWKDPRNQWNYNNIFKIIKKLNPDVLLLQEVTARGKVSYSKIYNDFRAEGFVFESIGCNTFRKNFLGNIIVAKITPQSIKRGWFKKQERPYQEDRCWVSMDFNLPNGKPLTVYGTHLEFGHNRNYSQEKKEHIRQKQIQELIDHIKNNDKQNALIGADFNAMRKEDHQYKVGKLSTWKFLKKEWNIKGEIPTYTMDTLKKEGFKDSFSYLDWQTPKFTVWAGIVIDFIFLTPNWELPVVGSYIYWDAASDHLPIIMDIKIN